MQDSINNIDISKPKLESLISVNEYLNPFMLDAAASNVVSLRSALFTGLEGNLDLAISRTYTTQNQFAYYSALGNFAPDPTLGFTEYVLGGHAGLPFNTASFFNVGGALANSAAYGGNSTTIRLSRPF